MTAYTLRSYPERLAVVRLGPGSEVPSWFGGSGICSVTVTATETSLVCSATAVPTKVTQEGPFRAFEVQGPLDFAMTGVLAELLAPLAEARISVFTLSTFDTDWILVRHDRADDASTAWRERGHTVTSAIPAPRRPS